MNRRTLLTSAATGFAVAAGCIDMTTSASNSLDAELEQMAADKPPDEPPTVDVVDGVVTVEGVLHYGAGASSCGTIGLAHAAYETSQ